MKALIVLGAIIGFLIGAGFGLAASSPWPSALWRASATALVACVLTRWWGGIWMQGLRDSLESRRRGNVARHPASIASIPTVKK